MDRTSRQAIKWTAFHAFRTGVRRGRGFENAFRTRLPCGAPHFWLPRRSFWRRATANTAQAVEMRDIAGWWLAIDDTFPKHWKAGAMTPMEEVLQINPDGRVTDRVMNFWAGSHRACLENKVCSDVPQIATARVRVSGDKLSFSNVVASNARLDTPSGEALVRKEAITASANWTVRLDGERLMLRVGRAGQARTLVRVDLDRLRRLHAAMQLASGRRAITGAASSPTPPRATRRSRRCRPNRAYSERARLPRPLSQSCDLCRRDQIGGRHSGDRRNQRGSAQASLGRTRGNAGGSTSRACCARPRSRIAPGSAPCSTYIDRHARTVNRAQRRGGYRGAGQDPRRCRRGRSRAPRKDRPGARPTRQTPRRRARRPPRPRCQKARDAVERRRPPPRRKPPTPPPKPKRGHRAAGRRRLHAGGLRDRAARRGRPAAEGRSHPSQRRRTAAEARHGDAPGDRSAAEG